MALIFGFGQVFIYETEITPITSSHRHILLQFFASGLSLCQPGYLKTHQEELAQIKK